MQLSQALDNITSDEAAVLRQRFLDRTQSLVHRDGENIVAFSGGLDSSVVAYGLHRVAPNNSRAVIGISASVSEEQRTLARTVAAHIGIPLTELHTDEVSNPQYVANDGMACYHCKATLYSTIEKLHEQLASGAGRVTIFNGTNKDDLADATRVGLTAAHEHRVASPLDIFSKFEIRMIACDAGLPNWNHAASPCLRSRLQIGVPATQEHLTRIAHAEMEVRSILQLPPEVNFRIRHLTTGAARLEIDSDRIASIHRSFDALKKILQGFGFQDVALQEFKTGSVSHSTSETERGG